MYRVFFDNNGLIITLQPLKFSVATENSLIVDHFIKINEWTVDVATKTLIKK